MTPTNRRFSGRFRCKTAFLVVWSFYSSRIYIIRSQDKPAKRSKTATATTSTAIVVSVPVVDVVAGHPSRCSDDRSSNVKPPLSVPVVEVPVVEVVAGVEQKNAGDDRDRLGDREQEQNEFFCRVRERKKPNKKFPQHGLFQIRREARHFHPLRSRAAPATMAAPPPPRPRPTPRGARPAQWFNLAADDDIEDGGGAATADVAHGDLLSLHPCSKAVMLAATRFCNRCEATIDLAPVAAWTAAPTSPRSPPPTPTKRADKKDEAAARTTTEPPVTRRTTTPPLAIASSVTAANRAPTTPRSPPLATPEVSTRWWMHETIQRNPGDSWVQYQTLEGQAWWWNRQTEEWIYRPLPREAWEHFHDLATGKIGCWNTLTGEWFFLPGGEDPRTSSIWL